jgi:hypothetical protein
MLGGGAQGFGGARNTVGIAPEGMGVVADKANGPALKQFLRRFFQKVATFFP